MGIKVDPRVYPVPKELLNNPKLRAYFEDLERFLHDLWVRSGAGEDLTATASTFIKRGIEPVLIQQINSVDDLTWDTDSFSWDSEEFTFDQDET